MRGELALAIAATSLAACQTCPHGDLAPLAGVPAYAVVLSTAVYDATSVAILDENGDVLREAFVDSGSRPAGLATALSGDVVLPSTPVLGSLALIDRLNTDVVDLVPLHGGAVQQVSVRGAAPAGWSPDPLDALALDATHLLVSRRNPNLAPTSALDHGSDLVVLDLGSGTVASAIDLSFFETDVGTSHVYARPNLLARAGSRVVVGLDRLSLDYSLAATGAVAIVDPTTSDVRSLSLAPLANCGQVRALPGTSDVAVVCAGQTFVAEDVRESTSGVAHVHVDAAGTATLAHSWRASDHAAAPGPTDLVATLDATHAVIGARGDMTTGAFDRLLVWDLAANTLTVAYTSTERFAIQAGAFDPAHQRLLVPEGARGVHRFAWDGTTLTDVGITRVTACPLLVRQVADLGQRM